MLKTITKRLKTMQTAYIERRQCVIQVFEESIFLEFFFKRLEVRLEQPSHF